MKRLLALLALLVLLPLPAHAWWNADWKFRKKITLNTSATGADLKDAVGPVPVAVRLHTGNFLFTDAKLDGSDLRFVAADDKTPLKATVEVFDSTNQLAIVWVQVPRIAAGATGEYFWMYSGNEKVAASDDAKGVFDPTQLLALSFGEAQPPFKDATAYANPVSGDGVKTDAAGLFGGAAVFDGAPLHVVAVPTARIAPGGAVTIEAWVKIAQPAKAKLFSWGALSVELADNQVVARVDKDAASGGALVAGTWTHVGVTVADRITLYIDGKPVATQPARLPELGGEMLVGQDYKGELDALGVASVARTADWFKLQAAQGSDGKLLGYGDPEAGEDGSTSYLKILFSSLTPDAKVVIAILAVMFLIAVYVMVSKALQIGRTAKRNLTFLDAFESHPHEYLDPHSTASQAVARDPGMASCSLARLYVTGMRELRLRVGPPAAPPVHVELSAQAMAAIKASIDSTLIRENQRLNRLMVLLTIAISGGPFLGLLGTVVGVMITFAAIAAQGDVNINAIAPGIAAALLATVAGLAVAIPSLFGYNYLITRIKGITADMQAFTDEFISKMAESQS